MDPQASSPIKPEPEEGEPIAEGALWTEWRHQGQLIALKPSDLIVVDPHHFCECMRVHPQPWFLSAHYASLFATYLNVDAKKENFSDIIRDEEFFTTAVKSCKNTPWKTHQSIMRKQLSHNPDR